MIDFKAPYLDVLNQAWAEHLAPRDANAPTLVSTFAGCGGSSLGFSMAGFRELMAVEWDANAVDILRLNFPHAHVHHGDINDLATEDVLKITGLAPGELDVLDGSPPCQGFSTAGRRDAGDSRNQLFLQFTRLLDGVQPKCFVMENVSGMVKGEMKIIFAEILRKLKSCGYRVSARLLNAKWFGVPQSRERLIFIGVRNDLGMEPSHPVQQTAERILWQAIGHLDNIQNPETGHVWIDESPAGRNTKNWLIAHKKRLPGKFAGQQKRSDITKVSCALTTGGMKGMTAYIRNVGCHPKYTRTFSELEYRLIGSFPQQFQFIGNEVYRRVGNSVPPLFMRAIANHIRENFFT